MTQEEQKNPYVTMVMVMSMDGVVNRATEQHEPVSAWTSAEDKAHLMQITAASDATIMGHKSLKEFPGTHNIVLTHDQTKWGNVSESLSYFGGDPKDIITFAQNRGAKNILLLGGPITNTAFLEAGLVDEVQLTVEPKIFGQGRRLTEGANLQAQFKVASSKILNSEGTMLLTYKAVHKHSQTKLPEPV